MKKNFSVLIVEDDLGLQQTLEEILNKSQIKVSAASSLEEAYEFLDKKVFDLILLDRIVSDGDTKELITHIRDFNYSVRILILSQKATEFDKVSSLRDGADDYMAKPFSLSELQLRINNLLFSQRLRSEKTVKLSALEINLQSGVIKHNNRTIVLRQKEKQILSCLISYKNQVISRDILINTVWPTQTMPCESTLDVYIRRLRIKLRPYSDLIRTVRGFGYILTDK